jgi:hypothetical protein
VNQKNRDLTNLINRRGGRRYGKPNTVVAIYDFPRYRLFECIKRGDFRSVLIKRPGTKRGLRLIDLDSLETFLNRFATGGEENGLVEVIGQEEK